MKYVEGWTAKTAIAGLGGARAATATALTAGAVASSGQAGVSIVSGTYALFLFFPVAMTILTLTGAAAGALAAFVRRSQGDSCRQKTDKEAQEG